VIRCLVAFFLYTMRNIMRVEASRCARPLWLVAPDLPLRKLHVEGMPHHCVPLLSSVASHQSLTSVHLSLDVQSSRQLFVVTSDLLGVHLARLGSLQRLTVEVGNSRDFSSDDSGADSLVCKPWPILQKLKSLDLVAPNGRIGWPRIAAPLLEEYRTDNACTPSMLVQLLADLPHLSLLHAPVRLPVAVPAACYTSPCAELTRAILGGVGRQLTDVNLIGFWEKSHHLDADCLAAMGAQWTLLRVLEVGLPPAVDVGALLAPFSAHATLMTARFHLGAADAKLLEPRLSPPVSRFPVVWPALQHLMLVGGVDCRWILSRFQCPLLESLSCTLLPTDEEKEEVVDPPAFSWSTSCASSLSPSLSHHCVLADRTGTSSVAGTS